MRNSQKAPAPRSNCQFCTLIMGHPTSNQRQLHPFQMPCGSIGSVKADGALRQCNWPLSRSFFAQPSGLKARSSANCLSCRWLLTFGLFEAGLTDLLNSLQPLRSSDQRAVAKILCGDLAWSGWKCDFFSGLRGGGGSCRGAGARPAANVRVSSFVQAAFPVVCRPLP